MQRENALARSNQKNLLTSQQVNRQVLPTVPMNFPSTKPLRIIIIRHAERADAVLGSDWSKKGFDRTGRYIRFSEHLPDA